MSRFLCRGFAGFAAIAVAACGRVFLAAFAVDEGTGGAGEQAIAVYFPLLFFPLEALRRLNVDAAWIGVPMFFATPFVWGAALELMRLGILATVRALVRNTRARRG